MKLLTASRCLALALFATATAKAAPGSRTEALVAYTGWTPGVVCAGDKALVRFYDHRVYHRPDAVYLPGSIPSGLVKALGHSTACRLRDGRDVRAVVLTLHTEAANGECGSQPEEIFSLWVGGRKVINREHRADKCDMDPVRAIYLDGRRLLRCDEARRAADVVTSRRCVDLSARLRRPPPSGRSLMTMSITWSAPGRRSFCKGQLRRIRPNDPEPFAGDRQWPQLTAYPRRPITVWPGPVTLDLDNSGVRRPAYLVEKQTHYFDGRFWLTPKAGVDNRTAARWAVRLSEEPEQVALARKAGLHVYAGDQTPYREERYVRLTPFILNRTTYLWGQWSISLPNRPTEIITRPRLDGTQALLCVFQATPAA